MPRHPAASGDFDFLFGKWQVHHRRLKDRLVGCTEWKAFEGQSETRPVLGGNGNVEDNVIAFPSGACRAIALRSHDPAQRTWAIWWLSAHDPHRLDTPVIGGFADGTGTFLATETLNDRPVLVRFLWLRTLTRAPRWEQAVSPDGGATWETNWTMDFTRA